MKKLLLPLIGAMLSLSTFARDIKYTYEGQTLTYTVLDENAKTVETKQGMSIDWTTVNTIPGNNVKDELVIPSEIRDGDEIYTVTSIGSGAFYSCTDLTSVSIPESVTVIGEHAFQNCSALISVNIPESVISIGSKTFCGCSSLTAVNIPKSVTSIGNYAFSGCSSLTSVSLPESVTSIGDYAFWSCYGLTSVYIPESVTSIGAAAFGHCRSLTSINIPESVTSIGDAAFGHCSSLTSINIPESVTSIGNSTFDGCTSLTSINIPESVTSIGDAAFAKCGSLETVILPMNLETLGSYVFEYCGNIKKVVCNGATPVESTSDVFDSNVYRNATLHVPSDSAALYKMVSPWEFFYNITDDINTGIDDVVDDSDKDAPCEIFNLNGVKVANNADNLPSGIYIRKSNGKSEKFIVR